MRKNLSQRRVRLEFEERKWEREKDIVERELKLRNDKRELSHKFRKKINTTKLIVTYILINCTVIELYSMWMMYKTSDLSALVTLIASVIGESITFITYSAKSTKENTSGGIVYDMAMKSNNTISVDDTEEGNE